MKRTVRRSHPVRARRRDGVAAAEFAVCLPLVMVLLLGTLEASTTIFLKQSLSIAAYEGARVAITPGANASDVMAKGMSILQERRVVGGSVSISPTPLDAVPERTWLKITVTAPAKGNSLVQGMFMSGHMLTGSASMMKEY